jgi:hypothetical protein
MSKSTAGADSERRRYMRKAPGDRRSLRRAALTGTALVAGAAVLSATGCFCEAEKNQIAELKAENAELRMREARVEVDENGTLKLVCTSETLRAKLCEYWQSKYTLEDTSRVAIPVSFGPCRWEVPGGGPQDYLVNALCHC